jgi:iron complex transport system substrate-binding protein
VSFAREDASDAKPGFSRAFFIVVQGSRQGRFVAFSRSWLARHRVVAAAVAFGLGAMSSAVRAQEISSSVTANASTREVVDEMGRKVRVPASATRIISLAPSVTETLYALGLQDRLVGDTDFCDYPADAQKKPKVGGAINPNLEVIAALHPDLVLVTKALNRLETVRALDTLGIPIYATDPHSVDEIISSTEKLADVLGAPQAGKQLGEDMQRRLEIIQERIGKDAPRRVFFIVWMEPLISVGQDTFVAGALRKAGGTSVVDSKQDWPQISLEEVVRLQPEYLVFAPSHSQADAHELDSLSGRPGWRILEAVQNHHFAVISDAVIRPAPRIVSAIEELAKQLHPAAFEPAPETEKELQKPIAAALPFTGDGAEAVELPCAR